MRQFKSLSTVAASPIRDSSHLVTITSGQRAAVSMPQFELSPVAPQAPRDLAPHPRAPRRHAVVRIRRSASPSVLAPLSTPPSRPIRAGTRRHHLAESNAAVAATAGLNQPHPLNSQLVRACGGLRFHRCGSPSHRKSSPPAPLGLAAPRAQQDIRSPRCGHQRHRQSSPPASLEFAAHPSMVCPALVTVPHPSLRQPAPPAPLEFAAHPRMGCSALVTVQPSAPSPVLTIRST